MLDAGEAIRKLALNVARYSGLAPLARPFVGGIGAILMLHRVTASPARPGGVNRHLLICPRFLDRLIADMKADGYAFVSMDEAIERLRHPRKDRFVTITADDAYRDNLLEALPVLAAHGAPITIYGAPGLIDHTALLWWDVVEEIIARNDRVVVPTLQGEHVLDTSTAVRKVAANSWLHEHLARAVDEHDLRTFLTGLAEAHGVDPLAVSRATLMNWDDLRVAGGHPLVTIGAHTVNHFNLQRLPEAEALAEMKRSADLIEARTGQRPLHLAYPYGYASAVGAREVRLAREAGFVSAVTTRHGVLTATHADHLHALPRISVNGRYQSLPHIRTMLSGVTTPLANAGRLTVTV
jgi:peptidoglycan/xylan/chitin deacetylase (PgdA/CDA1 family)